MVFGQGIIAGVFMTIAIQGISIYLYKYMSNSFDKEDEEIEDLNESN